MKKAKTLHERFGYLKRHFYSFAPHLTIRKLSNLLLNEIEMRLSVSNPRSLPPYIKVEPSILCQLRCKGCIQRDPEFKKQYIGTKPINLGEFEKIIDPLAETLLGISLSFFGEPLLNKDIVQMIKFAHGKNIAVGFPTNFSFNFTDDQINQLAGSGLDSLSVSLDGASEETYLRYRVGGNFNQVLKNVKSLSVAKKKLGLRRPRIIWKFVIFDYNEHEVDIVRNTYASRGFDSYEFVYNVSSDYSKSQTQSYRKELWKNKKPCYWLWNTMIIRWDGNIHPCCRTEQFNLGNALKENIKDVWRGRKYYALRRGFTKKDYGEKLHPNCRKCMESNYF
ncbi:MAG: SPASM domain-containing protein [Nitrospirae bacterium]|nr:SPASM domain-containing protein [Nitrospirota bacterium]